MTLLKDSISLVLFLLAYPFNRLKPAVLVYHSVDQIPSSADPLKLNVSPELFGEHLAYLASRRAKHTICFDDGYAGVYHHAFPVTQRHRVRSIVFPVVDFVDGQLSMDSQFSQGYSPQPLTWEQVVQMSRAGVEIGSHTMTHRNIAALDPSAAKEEAVRSKREIERKTGRKVTAFSYPFGHAGSFNSQTETILKEARYERAYVNVMGLENSSRDPYRIRRIRIYRTDTMFRFKMKVAGAYNWVDYMNLLVQAVMPKLKRKVPGS